MRIRLLCTASKPPRWVQDGYDTYARRLPERLRPEVVEVRPDRDESAGRADREDRRVLQRIAAGEHVVLLDEAGTAHTSRALAGRLQQWQDAAVDVVLVIGGPDGVGAALRARAAEVWSLSPLTLPHALVRVLLIEQLYRAWTLGTGHPYHRD